MYQKKTMGYAKKMRKARQAGEIEQCIFYFEKLMEEIRKVRKNSLIDERKNDYSLSHFYE